MFHPRTTQGKKVGFASTITQGTKSTVFAVTDPVHVPQIPLLRFWRYFDCNLCLYVGGLDQTCVDVILYIFSSYSVREHAEPKRFQ